MTCASASSVAASVNSCDENFKTSYYVITVGLSRPVSFTMLLAVSAALTSGATASAVSRLSASWPASLATNFSMYMRIVEPEEPVPAAHCRQHGG